MTNNIIVGFLIGFLCLTSAHAEEPAKAELSPSQVQEYIFAAIPQLDQKTTFSTWSPIITKLEEKTGFKIKVVNADGIDKFGEELYKGNFDIVYSNPYQALLAFSLHGYIPILSSSAEKLIGVVVVKKDSPIKDINDLNGKKIAFPSKTALGASLLVRAELNGIHNIKFEEEYVKNHNSVYLNIVKGFADAGGGVEKTLKQQPPEISDNLRVIYETAPVPSHPIIVHPRVGKENTAKIKAALLEIYEEDKSLFAAIPMNFPKDVTIDDYKVMDKLNLEKYAK